MATPSRTQFPEWYRAERPVSPHAGPTQREQMAQRIKSLRNWLIGLSFIGVATFTTLAAHHPATTTANTASNQSGTTALAQQNTTSSSTTSTTTAATLSSVTTSQSVASQTSSRFRTRTASS